MNWVLRRITSGLPRLVSTAAALVLLSGVATASVVTAAPALAANCGAVLATANGVDIKSNGADQNTGESCGGTTQNTVQTPSGTTVSTGSEWQCVEFVNRYYAQKGWIASHWFGDGNSLKDNLPSGKFSYQADGAITSIVPGDVVTLNDNEVDENGNLVNPAGHAGVVSAVNGNAITIANQNTTNVFYSAVYDPASKTLTSEFGGHFTTQGVIHTTANTGGEGSSGGPPVQMDNLAFVNLQYVNGSQRQVQVNAYNQSSNYATLVQNDVTGYPDVSTPNVVPLFNPSNGDLCFVNMTYTDGTHNQIQLVCYSEASNYGTMDLNVLTPYGSSSTYNPYIIPLFEPDGDLAFVYTQYWQGQVQVVAYSMASGYQTASQIDETHYADYTNVSAIRPVFENNGDLAFVNLQYVNGSQQQTQVVAYSMASGYTVASQILVTGYPYIQTAYLNTIFPMFNGNGDLSFINLAYPGGQVQVNSYSQSSGYSMLDYDVLTGYPDTTSPPVIPLFERLSS
jgi:hypothetical protein